MTAQNKAVVHRWRARLAIRNALLAVAHKRYVWHPTDSNRAKLALRRDQVSQAERVIARHLTAVSLAPRPVSVCDRAAKWIAFYEGGESSDGLFHPYWDKFGNVWTIGYGHTGGVNAGSKPLTETQARALLSDDLRRTYAPPVFALKLPSVNKQIAVIDAVYNLGVGIIGTSHTLGAALHRRDWKAAESAFLLYDRDANGQVLESLQRRRQAEARLFAS